MLLLKNRLIKHLSISIWTMLLACSSFHGAEIPAKNSIAKDLSKAALDRINLYCKQKKLHQWDFDLNVAEEKIYKKTRTLGDDLLWIEINGSVSLQFESGSRLLVECYNEQAERELTKLDYKTFREFDDPPSQQWSGEKVAEIARGFAAAALGELPADIGLPKYEFEHYATFSRQTNLKRYRVPYWRVQFPRVDKNGYEFQMEYIEVHIYEEFGPTAIFVKMPSHYQIVEGEPLKQEQALKAAVDYAHELMKRGAVADMFNGGAIDEKPVSAKLEIVKPNHLADFKELPAIRDIDLNARLAWVIWFTWTNNDPKDLRKKGGIAAWIDAHTGKPLGGDAY